MRYVALGAVYHGDNPLWLDEALFSIKTQTRILDVCLVVDGTIRLEHESVIKRYAPILKHVIRCEKNLGLSYALNVGCKYLLNKYDYIIRFDADDINLPDRFSDTCKLIDKYRPDILAMSVIEFNNRDEEKERSFNSRTLSLKDFRFKNSIYHPASAINLHVLEELGFYENVNAFEDWATWLKFAKQKKTLLCSSHFGVKFRVTDELIVRRFGWKYLRKEIAFSKHRLHHKYFTIFEECIFLLPRIIRNILGVKVFKVIFSLRS